MTIDIDNDSYWRPETGGALMGWHDPEEPRTEPMRKPLGDYEFPAYTFDKVGVLSPFWNEIMGDFKKPDLVEQTLNRIGWLRTNAQPVVYTIFLE